MTPFVTLGQFCHDPVSLCVSDTIKTQNRIQPQAPSNVGDIRQIACVVFVLTGRVWNEPLKCPHLKGSTMATLPWLCSSLMMETIRLLPPPSSPPSSFSFFPSSLSPSLPSFLPSHPFVSYPRRPRSYSKTNIAKTLNLWVYYELR